MNQEQFEVNYDQVFSRPKGRERLEILNEISSENMAFVFKTHLERWLAINRSRLNDEQISVIIETTEAIKPDVYEYVRKYKKSHIKAEQILEKLKSVFSNEDIIQFTGTQGDYISK